MRRRWRARDEEEGKKKEKSEDGWRDVKVGRKKGRCAASIPSFFFLSSAAHYSVQYDLVHSSRDLHSHRQRRQILPP